MGHQQERFGRVDCLTGGAWNQTQEADVLRAMEKPNGQLLSLRACFLVSHILRSGSHHGALSLCLSGYYEIRAQ